MGGELNATSPSGIDGALGTKIVFTIKTYSNERHPKGIDLSQITSFEQIRVLIISGSQTRDEEFLGVLHKIGLQSSVTTFHKATVNQVKSNLANKSERFNLIIISDDNDFDGFEAARALYDANLSSEFVILMVSSNDRKGNYMRCLTMGVDHYLVKPFDTNELTETLGKSFTYLQSNSSRSDLHGSSEGYYIACCRG